MPGHWMKGQKSHGDKRDNYKSGGSSAFSRTKRKTINKIGTINCFMLSY